MSDELQTRGRAECVSVSVSTLAGCFQPAGPAHEPASAPIVERRAGPVQPPRGHNGNTTGGNGKRGSPPNTIRALMMGQAGVTFSRVLSVSTFTAPLCSAVTPRHRRTGTAALCRQRARRPASAVPAPHAGLAPPPRQLPGHCNNERLVCQSLFSVFQEEVIVIPWFLHNMLQL